MFSEDSEHEVTLFLSKRSLCQDKQAWLQKHPSLELVEFRAVLLWVKVPFYARPLDLIFHSWEYLRASSHMHFVETGTREERNKSGRRWTSPSLLIYIKSFYFWVWWILNTNKYPLENKNYKNSSFFAFIVGCASQ